MLPGDRLVFADLLLAHVLRKKADAIGLAANTTRIARVELASTLRYSNPAGQQTPPVRKAGD